MNYELLINSLRRPKNCQSVPIAIGINRQSKGVALVIAVLVLAALTTLLATLSVRITMAKRRQDYMIEYQRARYALDSAMKYALSAIPEKKFELAVRDGLPDFSDLFWMNADQRYQYLNNWLATATDEQIEKVLSPEAASRAAGTDSPVDILAMLSDLFGVKKEPPSAEKPAQEPTDEKKDDKEKSSDKLLSELKNSSDKDSDKDAAEQDNRSEPASDGATTTSAKEDSSLAFAVTPDDLLIPGPYTADWPYVMEPIELEIGAAKVTIYIEDENAKLPLSWAITSDTEANKKAQAVLSMFYDWIGLDAAQRQTLAMQLAQIQQKKAFELNPNPIMLTVAAPAAQTPPQTQQTPQQRAASRRSRRRTAPVAQTPQQATTTQQRPASAHATDFAKLFHSALLDRQIFARPAIVRQDDASAKTQDSPLRYIALWGSQRVNVNTAPRHVLEAALTFGGDAVELTEKIIQQRRVEPFKDIDDLKRKMFGYSALIDRAKDYLTTTSNFYSIRVVSASGNARATAVATVIKEDKKVEQLAILYGL